MSDMTAHRVSGPPRAYRRIKAFLAALLGVFFRELQVVGLEHIPSDRGGILVAWHPNGVVDGILIVASFPGHVVLGARHGLFKWPLLGRLLKAMRVTPIYRRSDLQGLSIDEQRLRNDEALTALATQTSGGSFSMLFPEGDSHDASYLQGLKSGVARLYYRARQQTPSDFPPPLIIPVGLHYDKKRLFRSRVLVEFTRPIELSEALDVAPPKGEDAEVSRTRSRALMAVINKELQRVVLETEDWELHELFHRARKLVRAERAHRIGANPGRVDMDEKVIGLARIWTAYQNLKADEPEVLEATVRQLRKYHNDLAALGVEDHELERSPRLLTWWRAALLALQLATELVLVPPLLIIGYIVNVPPTLLLAFVAKALAKQQKDVASLKLLGGVVLYPVTWALWGGLAAWGMLEAHAVYASIPDSPLVAGLTMVVLGGVGGLLMVSQMAAVGATLRSLRVRLVRTLRPSALENLREQRSTLCDHLLDLAKDMELPGVVAPDGTVVRR